MNIKKHLFLLTFILIFLVFLKVDAKINELPLMGKTIYVDPGHGGRDPGALYKDLHESDINLEISNILTEKLEKKGAIVYQIRKGDYDLANPKASERKRSDLQNRVKLIDNSNIDMYLSVHLNTYASSTWKGAQVFYDDVNPENKKLADIIQKSFKENLKSSRKPKEISTLYMYRNIRKPGVLLEVGFLTNPNERYLLQQKNYQSKICDAIIEGVINYYNN